MAHFELRQDRLAQPHPLPAFELGHVSVDRTLEARFVAEQAIQPVSFGDIAAIRLEVLLPITCFCYYFSVLLKALYFFSQFFDKILFALPWRAAAIPQALLLS